MDQVLNVLKKILKYKKWLMIGLFCNVLEIITELFTPLITSNIINIGVQNHDIKYIIGNGFIMIFLTVVSILGGVFSTYFISKSIGYTIYDIRKSMFNKITKLSFRDLDQIKIGKMVTLFTNDLSLVQSVFLLFFRIFIKIPFIFLGSIVLCIIISYKLSILFLIIIPMLIVIVTIIMRKAYPYFEITQDGIDEVNAVVRENVDGVRVVKAFSNEQYEINRFDRVNKMLKEVNIKAIKIITLATPIAMIIINLGIVCVLWYGGYEVINNHLEIGNIVAFIQYLNSILSTILTGSVIMIMLAKSKASIVRVEQLLESDEERKKEGLSIQKLKGDIKYSNVYFKYQEGTGDYVLKNLNFDIKSGDFIGIIGPTGSGKSTLVKLLAGYYKTIEGNIKLDDQDYQIYETSFLRKQIEYVQNVPEFFSGTIEENLKFGNPKATKKQMLEALDYACFKLNHNNSNILKYKIEQKATNLSGGEKQRLGIARALLTNCNIVIFDDCFSALDYKTMKKIKKNIKHFLENKTTIWITSRISNIKEADSIFVLEEGIIKDIGPHNELLQSSKIYKDMYELQRSSE